MKPKYLYPAVAVLVLGGLLYVIALFMPEVVPGNNQPVIPAGYKQETLIDHTFVVPLEVTKSQVGDETVFSRTFNKKYQSSCDFIGIGEQQLIDIEMGVRLIEGDVKQAIDATMNRPLAWQDFLQANGTPLEGMGVYKIVGGKNVYELAMSVEWCGQTYDFVVIKPEVTLVVRTPIRTQDFSATGMNYSKIKLLTDDQVVSEETLRTQAEQLITSFK